MNPLSYEDPSSQTEANCPYIGCQERFQGKSLAPQHAAATTAERAVSLALSLDELIGAGEK